MPYQSEMPTVCGFTGLPENDYKKLSMFYLAVIGKPTVPTRKKKSHLESPVSQQSK